MLNKKEFYKALEFKRNFKIYIRKQVDNGYKIDIIPRIKEMVKRYYSSERKEYTEGKTYFGQIAYKEIIKYFDKNDMFSDMAAATEWKIHIIGARHYILKKCFNDLFPYRNDILEQLDDLTMEWTILKGIIMKQSITDRAYRENIQLRFKSIFTKEEKLFENLSDFCKQYILRCLFLVIQRVNSIVKTIYINERKKFPLQDKKSNKLQRNKFAQRGKHEQRRKEYCRRIR